MVQRKNYSAFQKEITHVINKFSLENTSNTPDFILSSYLLKCLAAFDDAFTQRRSWYNLQCSQLETEEKKHLQEAPMS